MDIFLVPMKKRIHRWLMGIISYTVPMMVARYGKMYTKRNIVSCGHRNHSSQK